MKPVSHVLILITLIAGALILDNYWKEETAFMKKLAVHHLKSDDDEKKTWLRVLRELSLALDSPYISTFKKDIYYLEQIDSTNSNEQFLNLIQDSLSESYAFKDVHDLWHLPSRVRAIYMNNQILASIDSMLEKREDLTNFFEKDPYELVITEVQLGNDSLRFQTEYFKVMDRDTPFINPFTRKSIDRDQIEVYEAKILEY